MLNTQVAVPNPFVPAFRNSSGLRLRATDAEWSHGERGPVVEGRAADLVSVLGDRPKALSACAATVSRCLSRGSAAGPVRPGDDLQVVARRILEVDATAAVVVVDLARPAPPRVGPVLHARVRGCLP